MFHKLQPPSASSATLLSQTLPYSHSGAQLLHRDHLKFLLDLQALLSNCYINDDNVLFLTKLLQPISLAFGSFSTLLESSIVAHKLHTNVWAVHMKFWQHNHLHCPVPFNLQSPEFTGQLQRHSITGRPSPNVETSEFTKRTKYVCSIKLIRSCVIGFWSVEQLVGDLDDALQCWSNWKHGNSFTGGTNNAIPLNDRCNVAHAMH